MATHNLIRFDWAMKRLLRNKANFAVLEGFLSELLKQDVKIIKLLESEGNQETFDDKYNRVDLLAENEKSELFIIEVQNRDEYDYFQRMAYGAAKVLTEYFDLGQAYKEVKKIYSINIVYFDLGQGEDYVYHGTTDFYGIHKGDKLKLSDKQKNEFGKKYPSELFAEYYVLKVNQFNDVAKDSLDEWIYYLKNNEIKDNFRAKGLAKAKELLKFDELEPSERVTYKKYLEDLHYKASMAWTMEKEAEYRIREEERKKGIEEGIEKEKIEIARLMLEDKEAIEKIMRYTGLTREQIEILQNSEEG